ncbi:hypothetical protein N657DRAFT_572209 [Parathielavia appendiculata]|uniref:Inheritance of peroxisomes protein 1 n=1 Tax=Parathielavia appendiculata TaxID=2587402 RepID=A0AAN6Z3Y8_9PEZI|nr:hypothetical protein N657DRAFT_572209 [Parathielavia appendiculata]
MDSSRPRSSGFFAPRRVFTAPTPPSGPAAGPSPQSAGGLVDTLYGHPNVKIVAFTAGARSLSVGPRAASGPEIEPGSLSWSSQLERTIAVGPFRIYRAPGSVAFLSCGTALQPILPKSQVWCVDEESSKFVLQIRRPQYWRIEVPVEEQEDVRRAQQLREVFDAILQFEKTECPFKRSFTVELPERPQTPVQKRPWAPMRRSSASLPLTPVTPVEIARLHEGTPRGSICTSDLRTAGSARRALTAQAGSLVPSIDEPISAESGQSYSPRRNAPSGPSATHVASLSQQAPVIVAPQPRARESTPTTVPTEKFKSPPTESSESILARESWLATPLPPSPPLSTPGSPRNSAPQLHTQELSGTTTNQAVLEHTVTSRPSQTWSLATSDSLAESECSATKAPSSFHELDSSATRSPPLQAPTTERSPTPTKMESQSPPKPRSSKRSPSQTSTSSSTRSRRRATTTTSSISPSSRRALSPAPPAATTTLLSPLQRRRPSPAAGQAPQGQQGALAAVRRLPLTVLHKTCEILMSPPSHLIGLMLRVAARIAAGEWKGLVLGLGEGGERVSVAWDWSEDDDDGFDFAQDRAGFERRRRGVEKGLSSGMTAGFGNGSDCWGGNGNDGDGEFWSRTGRERRRRMGPGRMKMAGAFPESDDDEADGNEEEEEDIGPLDMPRVAARDGASSSSSSSEVEAAAAAAAAAADGDEKSADRPTTGGHGGAARCGEQRRDGADAEWGID